MQKFSPKQIKIGLVIFLLAAALGAAKIYTENAKPTKVTWPQFAESLKQGTVANLSFLRENQTTFLIGDIQGKPTKTEVYLPFLSNLEDYLKSFGFSHIPQKSKNTLQFTQIVGIVVPILLLVLLFRLIGQGKMLGQLKKLQSENSSVMFADVAGIEDAKEEIMEIVEFLKYPNKFNTIGAKIPKGVLFVGPPGTGKTMLAKAVANEAGVAFYAKNGADFVELFVGLGASRVRNAFKTLQKNAPAILFIDEIDAIGKKRTSLGDGGSSERDQTLNALLVAMDGVDAHKGIIVIAATNRLDSLDTALIRPGRFDRQVHINLPDVKGREEILKVHAREVKILADVDLNRLAKATPGMSGAELANIINEAALLAAKENRQAVENEDLEYARDKVRWGKSRTLAMTPKQKETTTIHEAGHTIVSIKLAHIDPLHKVTIIPRGAALGATMLLPANDKYLCYREEALEQMALLFAGRAAEEIFLSDYSSGAQGDIHSATKLAKQMIAQWGMGNWLIEIDDTASDLTKAEIDKQANELAKAGLELARYIISENKESTQRIISALLEKETLSEEEVMLLINVP